MAQILLCALLEEIHVTNERHSGTATALSRSDSAYVPLFVEALVNGGVPIGLPRDVAQELGIETMLGSRRSVDRPDEHSADLKNTVTSPGEQ